MQNVASSVAIMCLGKIYENASSSEFFRNPLGPYTQMLLSSMPVLSDKEEKLKPKKVKSRGEIPNPVIFSLVVVSIRGVLRKWTSVLERIQLW